jgi:hypothetical protein
MELVLEMQRLDLLVLAQVSHRQRIFSSPIFVKNKAVNRYFLKYAEIFRYKRTDKILDFFKKMCILF